MVSILFGDGGGTIGFSFGGHEGRCPEPFDAANGKRLGGSENSHPLHFVRADELVRRSSDKVEGEIVLDGPVRVGEGIEGTLRVVARETISARKAALRLVGLRLVEERKSRTHESGSGTSSTESWVEANGRLFAEEAFLEPAIPAELAAGQRFEARFSVPAPRLGPPTAHLGEAIVAWALDARWDIAMGDDAFVAVYVPVAQHPDLIRAGVGKQGGMAVLDTVDVKGASISVTTGCLPPRRRTSASGRRGRVRPAGRAGSSSTGGRTRPTARKASSRARSPTRMRSAPAPRSCWRCRRRPRLHSTVRTSSCST